MRALAAVLLGIAVSLSSPLTQAAGDAAAGKSKSATCAACHGPDGNSPIPTNPRLAGQHASYIVHALEAYKSGARQNPIMGAFAAALSKQDMQDLAAYFSGQTGLVTPHISPD